MRSAEIALVAALVAPLAGCADSGAGRGAGGEPGGEAASESAGEMVGRSAPEYAAATLAGDTVALADLRGGAVLLNVWATWCVPCRQEMPDLQGIADRYADQGLQVIGVSIDQAGVRSQVRRFVQEHGIGFTILHDPSGRVTRAFRTIGVPETFLLDGHGTIRARWTGRLPMAEAEERVREVLDAGRPRFIGH